jgi:hypothetical protein
MKFAVIKYLLNFVVLVSASTGKTYSESSRSNALSIEPRIKTLVEAASKIRGFLLVIYQANYTYSNNAIWIRPIPNLMSLPLMYLKFLAGVGKKAFFLGRLFLSFLFHTFSKACYSFSFLSFEKCTIT